MSSLSFIIVNWDTKNLLLNCLASVYRTVKGHSFEIFVVDNGSRDGSIEAVRDLYSQVQCIENKMNLGFARANNIAFRRARADYFVLLNTDSLLTENAIEAMIDYMESNPSAGIAGAQLLNADGSKQNSFDNFPTVVTELVNKAVLRRLFPRKYPSKIINFQHPVEVESIIGACMVIRKNLLDQIGLFDEDYFFFMEETDLCYRASKVRWKIVHIPSAKVYHFQGQSASKSLINARIEYYRSRYIFFKKHRSFLSSLILKIGLIIQLIINSIFYSILSLLTLLSVKKFRERMVVRLNLLKWHFFLCPDSMTLSGQKE